MRKLINKFLIRIGGIVSEFNPHSLLEAGCGEGFVISGIDVPLRIGVDINFEALRWAKGHWKNVLFMGGNIYNLPFEDSSFDVVMSLEVLEHLHEPGRALSELKRVAKKGVIVSVPHEPFFRIGSFLRGKYISTLGNHPEHIQQFTPARLSKLFSEQFDRFRILKSFPWLIGTGYL